MTRIPTGSSGPSTALPLTDPASLAPAPKPAPGGPDSELESTVVRRARATKPRPAGAPPRPRTGPTRRPPVSAEDATSDQTATMPKPYDPYAPSKAPDVFSDPTPTVPRLSSPAVPATTAAAAEVAPAPSVLDRARAGVAAATAAATAAAGAVADKVAASTTSASDSEPASDRPASRLRRTRRARLRISRIDPWSVMKTSLLFGIAGGIIFVVATYVLMSVVEATGLFAAVNSVVKDVRQLADGHAGVRHHDLHQHQACDRPGRARRRDRRRDLHGSRDGLLVPVQPVRDDARWSRDHPRRGLSGITADLTALR